MAFDLNTLRGLLTLLLLVSFIGLWVWAWSRKRIPAFTEAANLPFADEAASVHSSTATAQPHRQTEQRGEPS